MSESREFAEAVVRVTATLINSAEMGSRAFYPDDERNQVMLGYMSVLLVKKTMDEVIEKSFKDPLELQMRCLDAIGDLYDAIPE